MKIKNRIRIYFLISTLTSLLLFIIIGRLFIGKYYLYKSKVEVTKELRSFVKDEKKEYSIEFTKNEDTLNQNLFNLLSYRRIIPQKFWLTWQNIDTLARGNEVGLIFYQGEMNIGFLIRLKVHDERLYYSYRFLPSIQESSSIYSEIYIFTFILSLLIFSIFIYGFMNKLSGMIDKLSFNLKMISDEEFNRVEEVEGEDEILLLSHRIKDTSINIKESLRCIEEEKLEYKSLFESLSHELKTPLTLINAYASRIGSSKDKNQKYQSLIKEETKRILTLNNELFLYSTFKGKTLEKKDFKLKELIEDLLIRYEDQISDYNIDLELDLEDIIIYSNYNYLDIALDNILRNSIDYALGSIKIVCRGRRLSISNDGSEIKDLSNIWKPFCKDKSNRKLLFGSSGLGLAITKEIIERLDMKINVSNEINHVEFIINLKEIK